MSEPGAHATSQQAYEFARRFAALYCQTRWPDVLASALWWQERARVIWLKERYTA